MAYYFGINSSYLSSYFSNGSSANQSSNSYLSNLYSGIGAYSTIRTGAYTKLLKSYYAKTSSSSNTGNATDTTETTDTNNSNTTTSSKMTASNASELKGSADSLNSLSFTEENRTKIVSGIKSLVDSYNKLVENYSSSKNAVNRKYTSLTSLTNSYSNLLQSVGITVNQDKTLSVDEDVLTDANMSTLKSTFTGSRSYTSQVSYYSNLMYNAASNGVDSVYTSKGTVNTLSTSSILDAFA